jgi:hypothetical protein
VLHAQEEGHQGPDTAVAIGDFFGQGASRPDEGIQLVDGAIGFDAGAVFGHPMATRQGSTGLVAHTRYSNSVKLRLAGIKICIEL